MQFSFGRTSHSLIVFFNKIGPATMNDFSSVFLPEVFPDLSIRSALIFYVIRIYDKHLHQAFPFLDKICLVAYLWGYILKQSVSTFSVNTEAGGSTNILHVTYLRYLGICSKTFFTRAHSPIDKGFPIDLKQEHVQKRLEFFFLFLVWTKYPISI